MSSPLSPDDAEDPIIIGEHGPEITLMYWHPTCYKCHKEKSMATSHCKSRMCPWCAECRKPI